MSLSGASEKPPESPEIVLVPPLPPNDQGSLSHPRSDGYDSDSSDWTMESGFSHLSTESLGQMMVAQGSSQEVTTQVQPPPPPPPRPPDAVSPVTAGPVSSSPQPLASTPPPLPPRAQDSTTDTQSSTEYRLRTIERWDPLNGVSRHLQVVTQNGKGSNPLVAICNVLLLRGDIVIRPSDQVTVTASYLLELLGDRLLHEIPESSVVTSTDSSGVETTTTGTNQMVNTALRLLPDLQHSLAIDPCFNSVRGFMPCDDIAVFQAFGIELVHGWCADPADSEEWQVLCTRCPSYKQAVELVAQVDHKNKESVEKNETAAGYNLPTEHDRTDLDAVQVESTQHAELVRDARIVQKFLRANETQLTFHGLNMLTESLPAGHICVLFRNNHFSTIYKHPNQTIYLLVADASLGDQSPIVWETLSDVFGTTNDLVDSRFCFSEVTNSQTPKQQNTETNGLDSDFALALSLQQEEESRHQQMIANELHRFQ